MSASLTSVTTPVNYRLLREALTADEGFTQTELAERADASLAQANRMVQWLMDKRHAERGSDGLYRVKGAAGLVSSLLPYQRSMGDALVREVNVRAPKDEVEEVLVDEGGVLCLESALEEQSEFFRGDRVCAYHEDPAGLADGLRPSQGGVLPVAIYKPDIPLRGDVEEGRRTTRFRTVVDMACDGKLYAAKDLVQDLWGVVLD